LAGESLSGQSGWALTGLAPGSLLAGYRVESRIGAGGMAMVLRARDEALGRTVALKILPPALAGGTEYRERFIRESRAVAAVDHPHIIPVYAAGESGGVLYLAMRFVASGDLRSLAQREGPLDGDRAVALLAPIASALDAAHAAGLVHRDVKPANILVDTSPGRPEHPYLSDFGLAKGDAATTGLTGTGQFLGTPDYAAPEQISGKPARPQTDQYALACVAYAVLAGAPPFVRAESMAVLWAHMYEAPPSLAARRPDLPAFADRILARALAKSPEDRYRTCADFIGALRDALQVASRPDIPTGFKEFKARAEDAARSRRPEARSQVPSWQAQTVTPPPSPPSRRQLTITGGPLPSGPSFVPSAAVGTGTTPPRQIGGHRAGGRGYDDEGYGPARRRWPVVTTALVLLVLLLGGGAFALWRYNQSQVYVGVRNGYVSIFRGTPQSVAGVSLSSLVEASTLKVTELRSSDQAGLAQTISRGSVSDAQQLIQQLYNQVDQCKADWQGVAAWPAREAQYKAEVAAASKSKGKITVPASDNPGPQPTPPAAVDCAPAAALGVAIPAQAAG
jgi:serine/threonine protein kinase